MSGCEVCWIPVRSDTVDIIEYLKGDSLFDKEALSKMREEESPHVPHHHKVKPVFAKGHCTFKDKLEAEKGVGELLWESGLTIHRIKGVLCLENCEFVLELQGVEDLFARLGR